VELYCLCVFAKTFCQKTKQNKITFQISLRLGKK
jgi:hypothetical protein